MDTIILVLGLIAIAGLIVWKRQGPTSVSSARDEEVGALKAELQKEKDENVERQGENKQLLTQYTQLKAEFDSLAKQCDGLNRKIAAHEESEERRRQKFEDNMAKLDAAKESLERERERLIRADEAARAEAEAQRDRVWAEHEKAVISTLTYLCKQPQYAFTCFSNTNLPDGFDGSLKPDFMIEFLDQYVIFDAKKSKQESLQTYINNTIKNTVQKVKKNPKIAAMIYLVVPSEAISELKTHHYVHDGYTLYVVSPESLAPIIAGLKRITTYEFADQMDPQQRDNIVQLIAELDFHINLRNAADAFLTTMGAELLEKAQKIDPQMAEEVALKKQPMNAKASIAASEIKKLVMSPKLQKEQIFKLIAPNAKVRKKDLEAAETLLTDSLFS